MTTLFPGVLDQVQKDPPPCAKSVNGLGGCTFYDWELIRDTYKCISGEDFHIQYSIVPNADIGSITCGCCCSSVFGRLEGWLFSNTVKRSFWRSTEEYFFQKTEE